MPRPKKAKVEVPNSFGADTAAMSTGTTDVEEASASTEAEQGGTIHEDSLEAQYKEERKELRHFAISGDYWILSPTIGGAPTALADPRAVSPRDPP